MAGKQGRWAAGPGRGQPAGKLGAHGVSGDATSGTGAPQQADTKRYPVAAPASSAKLPSDTPSGPVRGEIKSRGTNVEDETTGTVEVTSIEEITNVSATSSRSTRLVRRLPLPAPCDSGDPSDDEDEYTEVQISKSVPPELLELSESPQSLESLELSESTELSEAMTSASSSSIARGRRGSVQAPRGRKQRKAPQEPTLTELEPVVLPSEVTRTITEATATVVTSPDELPKLPKLPKLAKLPKLPSVRRAPAAPAARAPAPAASVPAPAALAPAPVPAPAAPKVEAAALGAVEVATAQAPAAPVDAERTDDLLVASESEMPGATAQDLGASAGRRWLAAPAILALGIALYFTVGALSSSPTQKATSLAQRTAEDAPDVPRAVEPLEPAPVEVDNEVQPAEEAQPVLEPEMVFQPGEAAAEPETTSVQPASKETASVPAASVDPERTNRESSRSARRAHTRKSETPTDKREPGGKQVAQQFYKKGTSAFVGGQLAVAEREFQSALRADPGFALALRGLGLVYERQGQKSKAVGAFRRYLKRSPRAKDADKVNERIARLGG